MNYSKKRTCKGCQAWLSDECILGFEIDSEGLKPSIPLEPCFKPVTGQQMKACSMIPMKAYQELHRVEIQ